MKIPRVVVVGSVNTAMVVMTSRLPAPGETIAGGRFLMVPGGKGANQAVAAARLGAQFSLPEYTELEHFEKRLAVNESRQIRGA